MKFVVISDTHGDHRKMTLPPGDMLIHCGDMSSNGTHKELVDFAHWFEEQNYSHKILIAGNHDRGLENSPDEFEDLFRSSSFEYLEDQAIEIAGIRFWGSPITPRFYDWSFMKESGPAMKQHWTKIPEDVDVLITHGPPFGIMDAVDGSTQDGNSSTGKSEGTVNTGCPDLLERVKKITPSYHLFGHIHEGYGQQTEHGINFVNASSMNSGYCLQNAPVVIDFNRNNR